MARSSNNFKRPGEASDGASSRPTATQSRKLNRLQDEIYREMFLLESKRPGSEIRLALALLRAIVASERMTNREELRNWLATICPRCLQMIEDALGESRFPAPSPLKDPECSTSFEQ